MKPTWHTAWHGQDIVVYRDDAEVDRVHAPHIERVVFLHRGAGDTPGDLVHAVVELEQECLVFAADTGFAGRVNFERHDFWAERACVYWASASRAVLPARLRRGRWFLPSTPMLLRVPRAELAPLIDAWALTGPQTWEQRKWRRIEDSRPFAADSRLRA
jgi:glyoxylase-like metal-dependent hydrolase (beta-lactamase superfamily II)